MNRGRHRKKKIIQKIAFEDVIIKYLHLMKNDYGSFNFKINEHDWLNPYFSINEQRKT